MNPTPQQSPDLSGDLSGDLWGDANVQAHGRRVARRRMNTHPHRRGILMIDPIHALMHPEAIEPASILGQKLAKRTVGIGYFLYLVCRDNVFCIFDSP